MSTATSLGQDPLFMPSSSSSESDRAAAIKIRFADIIIKSKYRKVIEESDNKSEALMKIKKEEQILERKRLEEERAMMEERMKIRQEARVAAEKVEEKARLNIDFQHPLSDAKELINLCGGSRQARSRFFFKQFGLVLKPEIDDDLLDDLEEGEIV